MVSVSIVIPSYNCAAYLPAAIESVLNQTFTDLEVLVVDDGSTDATAEVVKPYLGAVTFLQQKNKGLPGARNTGIREAKGEYIALLDADDAWTADKLALQMPLFAEPQVGVVYSDFAVRYEDGRFLGSYLSERPLASEGFVVNNYLRSRFLFPSTMVLRRACLDQCGLFDEEMLAAEDIELFARICLRWQVRRVDRQLMIRTEGTHNITANNSRLNAYTILAFDKILAREPDLPKETRRVLLEELGRQLWWRGYAQFKQGHLQLARPDLLRSIRCDLRNARSCAPLLAASLLPAALLRKLQPTA